MKRTLREFVVIVLGVLTALLGESLVTEWRASATADGYRASIAADLREDIRVLREAAAFYGRVLESGRVVRAWLEGADDDTAPGERLGQIVFAGQMQVLSPASDAWDDLTSTGQIALLEEHERVALGAYYRRDQERAQIGPLPVGYRETVYGLVPVDLLLRVTSECVLYDSLDPVFPPCEEDFGANVGEVLRRVRAAPGLAEELNVRMYRVDVEVQFLEQMLERAEGALALLPPQGEDRPPAE